MDINEATTTLFTTRMRQMILQYKEVRQENDTLHTELKRLNDELETLQKNISQIQSEYDSLKAARMLEISNNDIDSTKKKIAKLIRDVNKCITMLNDK